MAFCTLLLGACSHGVLNGGDRAENASAPIESHSRIADSIRPEPRESTPRPKDLADATTPGDVWAGLPKRFSLSGRSRPEVAREILWLQKNPGYLAKVSRNATPFIQYVAVELEKRGLPGELALLPIIESGYNPGIKSPYGATGLWQFMDGTGNKLGLDVTPWYDGRMDVMQSTDAALRYLQALQQRFDGDWLLAVAAYNAGWGTIEKAVVKQHRKGRKADIWSLDVKTETRDLAARLLALAEVVSDPDRFGVDLPKVPDKPYFARIELPHSLDLRQLANALGAPVDEFKLLNAAWRRGHTGATSRPKVLVPIARVEAAIQIASSLPSTPVPALPTDKTAAPQVAQKAHVVRPGDSLWTIAQRYHLDVGRLAAANGLKKTTTLKLGQRINLGKQDSPGSAKAISGKPPKGAQSVAGAHRYKVREGDSLWTISRQFKVTIDQLLAWNGLKPKQDLQPGQEIVVSQS